MNKAESKEPDIIINCVRITDGMPMKLTVSVENFAVDLSDPDYLGKGPHARVMRRAYVLKKKEIRQAMIGKTQSKIGESD